MKWKIKNIIINNQIVLAPMAGISNPSYMKICEELGLGLAITELISSEAVIRNNKKTFDMLNGIENLNIPVGIQIFGSNPKTMAEAAKIIYEKYPKTALIDINMGCPVPKVAIHSNAGSALLKDLSKIQAIVTAVVKAVPIPVTVKIRSGWDDKHINATEVAKVCEKSGASAIFVHPRTRAQGYNGKANWDIIKEVKETVKIPVIGNGDIKDIYTAKQMLEKTKCDAIMIGRATQGNPFIIKEIKQYIDTEQIIAKPTNLEKIDMIIKHITYICRNQKEKVAVLEMRSHIAWYLKGMPNGKEIKNKIFECTNISDIINIISDYRNQLEESNE